MASLNNGAASPGTTITTTSETLVANVPTMPLTLPAAAPQNVIVRGTAYIATGVAATSLTIKLRQGLNNTSTNQIGNSINVPSGASGNFAVVFHFIDTSGTANLNSNGYSITVVQNSATGNGTVTAYGYEVDVSIP